MRRIICITIALMLLSCSVFAAPVVTNKDASQNIINISGNANAGDTVSIFIVNSGYTLSDVYINPAQAAQYVRSEVATSSGYSFDVKMNVAANGGGKYTVVVNNGTTTESTEFSFYPVGAKLEIINLLKAANVPSDLTTVTQGSGASLLARAIDIYDLNNFYLTKFAKSNDLAKILVSEFGDDINDADTAIDVMKASIYVSALNSSAADAFKNGYLTNPQILGIENEPIYISYSTELNEDGASNVRSSICSKGFTGISDFFKAFQENTVLQLIINNKKYGNGHVADIFSTYSSVLTDAGFNLSKLSKITNKSKLYDKLIVSKATTLSSLATEFNAYKEESDKPSGGGGGGFVGGSSSTVTSTPSSVPEYIQAQPEQNPELTPAVVFNDIESVSWAKDAITALSKNGVINGRGDNTFDPNGKVTRAEFVKMIIGAAELVDQSADCNFSDVADDWSKPYIASAVKYGIVNGISDVDFGSSNSITREQAAVIVYRTLLNIGKDLSVNADAFSDESQTSDYAKEAISKLAGAKIINGKGDNMFAPLDSLTRAEAAKIIYTALIEKFTK